MKIYFLGLAALLSVGSCHKKQKETIKPIDNTKTTATQPKANPGSTSSAVTTPKKPATQPEKPKSGTIFWVSATKGNIASLACFDADSKSFIDGDDCALWPKSSTLRDNTGNQFSLTPVAQSCASGKVFSGTDAIYAFWPGDTKASVVIPEKIDIKKLSSTEKKALDKEVKAKTKEKYEIDFVASIDINNDQKKERFYGVTAKKTKPTEEDTGAPFAFSGLFYADGKQANTLVLLSSSTIEQTTLQGATDLDQDGSLELWFEKILTEDNIQVSRRYTLERIVENALEEIATRDVCL